MEYHEYSVLFPLIIVVIICLGLLIYCLINSDREFSNIVEQLSERANTESILTVLVEYGYSREIIGNPIRFLNQINTGMHAAYGFNEKYIAYGLIEHIRQATMNCPHIYQRLLAYYDYNNIIPINIDGSEARPSEFFKNLYHLHISNGTRMLPFRYMQHLTRRDNPDHTFDIKLHNWFTLVDIGVISPTGIAQGFYSYITLHSSESHNLFRTYFRNENLPFPPEADPQPWPTPQRTRRPRRSRKQVVPKEDPRLVQIHIEDNCCICFENESNVLFVPCGHLSCCKTCSSKIQSCPLCKVGIRSIYRLNHDTK